MFWTVYFDAEWLTVEDFVILTKDIFYIKIGYRKKQLFLNIALPCFAIQCFGADWLE